MLCRYSVGEFLSLRDQPAKPGLQGKKGENSLESEMCLAADTGLGGGIGGDREGVVRPL